MNPNTDDQGNAIVVDTNVFIYNPESIDSLREGGNTIIIPWTVLIELDGLKNKPDIKTDVRDAIRRIDKITEEKDPSITIIRKVNFKSITGLSKNIPDHKIIATAINVAKENRKNKRYKFVKFLSKDRLVRLLAREINQDGMIIEDYWSQKVEVPKTVGPREINVVKDEITNEKSFLYNEKKHEAIEENEGVICFSDIYGNWEKSFTAIRKGNIFKIVPQKINAIGIVPYSMNGNGQNWIQFIALAQLLDPKIKLIFLQGGAGTGKTLLAVASAIEKRKEYNQILITRPMVPLDNQDKMGFLPGGIDEKINPWTKPIRQSLSFIKGVNKNSDLITRLEENNKITMQPLDYIRGMSYHRIFLIVDEAQNLTPHQVKTIITRAGIRTKIVFTGDLSQIDLHGRIDQGSSGLAYAIQKMKGHKLVGTTTFTETVRSELADLGAQLL